MTNPEQSKRKERILDRLARLFVQIPDSTDRDEVELELRTHGVDIHRLGGRIRELVEAAGEKDRLAWLEGYRKELTGRPRLVPRPKAELPKTRAERIGLIESLQRTFAEEGLRTAVGFKKLKLEELSDDDLARIIAILQEESETQPAPSKPSGRI